ncbi:degenerin-like protein unc-105 [Littorina saxatilis]|uniref:degenerin-like protein unc-105 n=1 Tax=Littorina saxatilis TaxID=31220 RepID=UPI0038B4A878
MMSFLSYPVSTVVTLQFDDTVAFPAVTICNLNQMRKSQYEGNAKLNKLKTQVEERYDKRKHHTTSRKQPNGSKKPPSIAKKVVVDTQAPRSSYATSQNLETTSITKGDNFATSADVIPYLSTTAFNVTEGSTNNITSDPLRAMNTSDDDVFAALSTTTAYSLFTKEELSNVNASDQTAVDATSSLPFSSSATQPPEKEEEEQQQEYEEEEEYKEEEEEEYTYEYPEDYSFESFPDPFHIFVRVSLSFLSVLVKASLLPYTFSEEEEQQQEYEEEEEYKEEEEEEYTYEYPEDYSFESFPDPFENLSLWASQPDYDLESRTQIRSYLDQLAVSERFEFGHQMSRMLLDCGYQKSQMCSRRNFTSFYNHYFGNCYTFNKEVVADAVSKPGPSHGLSLLLNVESEEYMKQSQTVGFKVLIHPSDSMPFPEDDGVIVSPGFATSIGVVRMDLKRSPPPYGKCRNYGKKENLEVNMYAMPPYEVGYSGKACQRTCYQRKVIETCECCDLDYPCLERSLAILGATSVSFCLQEKQIRCLVRVNDDFERGVSGCEDECLPACQETTFTEEVSMGVWPSEASLGELQNKLHMLPKVLLEGYNQTDVTFFRKNLAKVHIYYKQLNYERIETEPAYNWYRLLSDLGGQLGLWLGFSLLTAVEFLELVCIVIRHVIRKLRHTGNNLGRVLMNSGEKINEVHV